MIYEMSSTIVTKNRAFIVALVASTASPILYYSNGCNWPSHSIHTFLVTLALFIWFKFISRNRNALFDVLAGLVVGFSFITRLYGGIIVIPFFIWYLWKKRYRRLFLFMISFGLIALIIFVRSKLMYGSWTYYFTYGVNHLAPSTIRNRLLNPYNGFFFLHPVFIFSFPGIYQLIKGKSKELGLMTLGIFLSFSILLTLTLHIHEGFSHRALLCLVPELSIGLASTLDRYRNKKFLFFICGLAGYSLLLFLLHISGLFYISFAGDRYIIFKIWDPQVLAKLPQHLFQMSNLRILLFGANKAG